MVEAALVALPVTPSRAPHDQPPHGVAAVVPTVDLPSVALAADGEWRMATRAHGKSMVGHVLARADLLPGTSSRARLRAVDASSRDLEGRELSLLAFTNFGARPVPRSRGRRRSRNFLRSISWPRITRIGVADHSFTLIEAKDHAHAVELAMGCPVFAAGGSVEVRPVMKMQM